MLKRAGRGPLVAMAVIAAFSALVLPWAATSLGVSRSFLPAFFAVIVAADLLTAFFFVQQHRANHQDRELALAAAYLFSGLIVIPHALAFPGVVTEAGPLNLNASSATWLWTAWHVGFPILLARAAVVPGLLLPRRRERAVSATVLGIALLVAVCAAVTTLGGDHLPTLIVVGDFRRALRLVGPWAFTVNLLAIVAVARAVRRGDTLERWVLVAATASTADVVLTLLSGARFTLGWYSGRMASIAAASVVLAFLVIELGGLYRRMAGEVERLTELDRARNTFLGSVSHELRTPLTSILGYLELLADGDGGELTTDQARMVGVADRSSRRLLSLIDELLLVARLEAGTVAIEQTPVDLHAATEAAVHAITPAARAQRVDVRFEGEAGAVVLGDPVQLDRVLINLLSNAVKFSPDGGEVSVSVRASGDEVRVLVRDTGIGIPLAEQSRLFERFFRASNTAEHAVAGTGIGLAIVKSIVEAHGGSIALESAPGIGTAVEFTLPVLDAPVAQDEPAAA